MHTFVDIQCECFGKWQTCTGTAKRRNAFHETGSYWQPNRKKALKIKMMIKHWCTMALRLSPWWMGVWAIDIWTHNPMALIWYARAFAVTKVLMTPLNKIIKRSLSNGCTIARWKRIQCAGNPPTHTDI